MENANLSPEEQAYFDTRGETVPAAIKEDPAQAEERAEADSTADVAEPEADDVEEQPRQSMVPHKALHAEREKRKALEKEVQELREFRIRLEERQKYLAELDAKKAEPAKPEPEAIPDPDEDVFAASKYALTKTQELEKRLAEQAELAKQEAERRALSARMQADEEEFRKEAPDYDDAMKYLIANRHAELEAFGVEPARRQAIVSNEAMQIIQAAVRAGRNPAKFAYEIASKRGWQAKPVQPAQEAEETVERTEKLEKAKAASRSLSGVGGAPTGPMTAERLIKMSIAEFNAYERKNPEVVRRLLAGG